MSGVMSPVFTPTVKLTDKVTVAIVNNKLQLRPGQWVQDQAGNKGQYIGTHDGIIFVSWCGKGDGFVGRTQRFCRAVWHHNKKHYSISTAILSAPSTTPLSLVKEAVQHIKDQYIPIYSVKYGKSFKKKTAST